MNPRLLLAFVMALILLVALLVAGASLINYTLEQCTRAGINLYCNPGPRCYEDMPCWDCKSMQFAD